MTRFKFRRGVRRSYDEQGYCYFVCRSYARLGKGERARIDELIHRAGGEYAAALRDYLLTDAGWSEVCQRYYLSDRTLCRIVKRFIEEF